VLYEAAGLIFFGSAAVAWPRAIRAQQDYRRFIPFLIDLPGWTGPQPTGTDQERKGGRVITASRGYIRDGASFNAFFISGTAVPDDTNAGVNVTVGGTHKSTSIIDGFQVVKESTPVFVLIAITLSPNAMFNLIFNGVSEDEAMAIARKFDWKGIAALLN
jgi:hypothetical protein